jgi:hypothetical protein
MKYSLKVSLIIKMENADKTFINIMCKPEYDAEGYKEVLINMYGKQYLVKFPLKNVKSYMTSHNKIRYRVEHKPVLKNNKQTEIISTF